jgi:glutamyl-tRNA synthetase
LCLLGWSPKDNREKMSRQELMDAFSFEGINRHNAVVNFSEEDPFDPKAVWLNSEYIRELSVEELANQLLPFALACGLHADEEKMLRVTPLIRERIKTLAEVTTAADFFFLDTLPPFDAAELIPQKGDAVMARAVLESAQRILAVCTFDHESLDAGLRAGAQDLHVKTGQMFQPIRVAVCGRKNAPPLFETLEVLGRETCLARIVNAIGMLN